MRSSDDYGLRTTVFPFFQKQVFPALMDCFRGLIVSLSDRSLRIAQIPSRPSGISPRSAPEQKPEETSEERIA